MHVSSLKSQTVQSHEEPDGTITAIDGLQLNNNEANAEGWYTVNGMKLDAAPTQKGTYINNGKKVIVK